MVFCPIYRRAANNVLRLRYRRKLGGARWCAYISRVLARIYTGSFHLHPCFVVWHRICKAGKRGGEDIVVRLCCLRSILLYRLCEAGGVSDCDRLELGQRL
jgi:hypothetical protein